MEEQSQMDWLQSSEWAAAEKEEKDTRPQRLKEMHAVHGTRPGSTCGECQFLTWHTQAKRYYKCAMTRMSYGPATDWRISYLACGLFQERK